MNNSGEILWKGKAVGQAKIIAVDMWYVDAAWTPYHSEDTREFEHIISQMKASEVIKNPAKGLIAELQDTHSFTRGKYLILGLDGSTLSMRMISDEIVDCVDRKLLTPWKETDNPGIYEKELKKKLSFFHPLKWKNVRAIGNRFDPDVVLFEITTGKYKYAVVHLTWQKEHSAKSPSMTYYKDWKDVYENCILKDHEDVKQ